jgi:hypothetical protein
MHRTIATLIDSVRLRLGDNGEVITRAEILDWIADGYGRMVREAQTPATIEAHDVPPKVSMSYTHDWERQYINGTSRKFTYSSSGYDATYVHETQTLAHQTAEPSLHNVTQLHMLAHIEGGTDGRYEFSLPRRHTMLSLWYDHKILYPVPGRDLEHRGEWRNIGGIPTVYVTDDTDNTFDIYRIVTSNHSAYQIDRPLGIPRKISGDRTYAIDARGEAGTGLIREISSPDRQYHNTIPWQRHGTIRSWASSEDNLLSYTVREPDRELTEDDTLSMVPVPLEKYVTYYALAMIYNRQGELYEPNLSEHYRFRYRRGVQILSRIRNVAYRDAEYSRDQALDRRGPALPSLPDNYQRLRR